ncbi:MAG: hypothetical protein HZB51_11530 [Chloroflexi bacterium]|nr:hypothetical protein [Chloroflexota bacterium]
MDAPRVFLICVNKLVCEAVNVLLCREGMVLLGMETDPDAALNRVKSLDPDIVLVEGLGTDYSGESTLVSPLSSELLERKNRQDKADSNLMTALLEMTYKRRHLRIIQLCLPNEELRIYHQELRRFLNTHDLVAAIQSAVQIK